MSIGIIGGADGPTSIFVSSSMNPFAAAAAALFIIAAAIAVWKIWKKKRRDRK